MWTLGAADYIAGVSDAASKVTVTVFGMELSASSGEVYKRLSSTQLPITTAAAQYTVPASTIAMISDIVVVNTDTVARTFQLFAGGITQPYAVTGVVTIQPNQTVYPMRP
jgi:hypothetical protein